MSSIKGIPIIKVKVIRDISEADRTCCWKPNTETGKPIIKVKVIWDKSRVGRTCFWKTKYEKYTQIYYHFKQEYEFDFIHLADVHDHNPAKLFDLFDNYRTDIIIFNWDSINNDSIYGSDIEIFNSDSSKFEIGGKDTKAAINMNTAEKYSRSVTIPKAITIKYNPNIQRNIPLNVIFTGSF